MNLFYLPGFLGKPEGIEAPVIKARSLDEWARAFNQFAASFSGPRMLVGYSMGGRQALHALLDAPELYEQAVLVSTNPGLKTSIEKSARYITDLRWSERFLHEEWNALIAAWDSQPVFKDSAQPERLEKDYDRKLLAHQLCHYSLGMQRNLRNEIATLDVPMIWIAGERDVKFCGFVDEMAAMNSSLQTFKLKNLGHRISFQLILEHVIDKIPQRFNHGKMAHSQRI